MEIVSFTEHLLERYHLTNELSTPLVSFLIPWNMRLSYHRSKCEENCCILRISSSCMGPMRRYLYSKYCTTRQCFTKKFFQYGHVHVQFSRMWNVDCVGMECVEHACSTALYIALSSSPSSKFDSQYQSRHHHSCARIVIDCVKNFNCFCC